MTVHLLPASLPKQLHTPRFTHRTTALPVTRGCELHREDKQSRWNIHPDINKASSFYINCGYILCTCEGAESPAE